MYVSSHLHIYLLLSSYKTNTNTTQACRFLRLLPSYLQLTTLYVFFFYFIFYRCLNQHLISRIGVPVVLDNKQKRLSTVFIKIICIFGHLVAISFLKASEMAPNFHQHAVRG